MLGKTMKFKFCVVHNAAEVYPIRQGQIFPICVSVVRFCYVNILIMQQDCKKIDTSARSVKIEGNWATRVQILNADLRDKRRTLFFARYV